MLICIIVILAALLIITNYLWAARANSLLNKIKKFNQSNDFTKQVTLTSNYVKVVPLNLQVRVPMEFYNDKELANKYINDAIKKEFVDVLPSYCEIIGEYTDPRNYEKILTLRINIVEPRK